MDNSKEQSKFSSLPLQDQLSILKKLSWTDRKSARLTSTDWFELINFVQNFGFTICDNQYIKPIVLKWPFYSRVASLKVVSAFKPIPIYSSTRMNIPKAAELVLGAGNSEDNVVKLLRYYAAGCNSLGFQYGCFTNVVHSTKMKMDVVLANITKFSFNLGHFNDRQRDALEAYNQSRALSEFLSATSMPNLKTFAASLIFIGPECFNTASVQKFVRRFGIFMDKHGQLISSFVISYEGYFCAELFQHFSKLPKVTNLTCYTYFYGVNIHDPPPALRAALWTAFGSFTKLELVTFGPPLRYPDHNWHFVTLRENIHTQLARMVLANNQNSLTTIINPRLQGSLRWIHDHSYPNLTCLKFSGLFDMAALFSNELSQGYKFPNLREMKVKMRPIRMLDPEDGVVQSDSGNAFIRWIVQVGPSLKNLTLFSCTGPSTLTLAHVRTLLLGLHDLKYFKIRNWAAPATSAEVYTWFENQQPQIEHTRSGWGNWDWDFCIKSRPLIEAKVPAD